MGISKRCCYLCDLLLQQLSTLSYRGATGKVFAWALPPWDVPEEVQESIWRNLKDLIRGTLDDMGLLMDDRFHSGTEGGQSDVVLGERSESRSEGSESGSEESESGSERSESGSEGSESGDES